MNRQSQLPCSGKVTTSIPNDDSGKDAVILERYLIIRRRPKCCLLFRCSGADPPLALANASAKTEHQLAEREIHIYIYMYILVRVFLLVFVLGVAACSLRLAV